MDINRLFAAIGNNRLIDRLRPKPRIHLMRGYLMARWRRERGLGQYYHTKRIAHEPRTEHQRGWMPGRWRLDGMQAPRRVINPAVRFATKNRLYNEIVRRRRKQGAYPPPYPWAKRRPLSRR